MFSASSKRPIDKWTIGLYILVLLASALFFYKHANHNWDIVPYSTLVQQMKQGDTSIARLHQQAYEALSNDLPAESFQKLTEGKEYRVRTFTDPVFFESQLGFYRIKWGYNLLNVLFSYITGSNARGVSLTSILAWLAIGFLLLRWFRGAGIQHIWALCLSLVILFLPFMIEGARTASPDMLSAAVFLYGFYFLWRQRLSPALLFMIFSVLVRPDNAVLAGLSCVYVWVQFPMQKARMQAAGAAVLVLLAAAKLLAYSGGTSMVGELYQDGYGQLVLAGLSTINESFLPLSLLVTILFFAIEVFKFNQPGGRMVLLLWLATAIKFTLVPVLDNRFYYPIILLPFILGAIYFIQKKQQESLPAAN